MTGTDLAHTIVRLEGVRARVAYRLDDREVARRQRVGLRTLDDMRYWTCCSDSTRACRCPTTSSPIGNGTRCAGVSIKVVRKRLGHASTDLHPARR
ncbi:hypothetical protein FNL39_105397 [Nocardia caishijiensis]|uniref:Uncharacterized protein n=1 Tax=Nocardia caishijiensis TaxID=184756 RepID=A0ABQ6YL30_9NOCA|nr:hypothetical protein FNL39_105397 [Nocardia caishijiensis]